MDLLHKDTMDIYHSQLSNIRFKVVNNYHKDLATKLKTIEELPMKKLFNGKTLRLQPC